MKTATFMMGLPGSGKSTVSRNRFAGQTFLDPDEIKKEHPLYDPKNVQIVHEWSKEIEEKRFLRLITEDNSFVVDGTGTNAENLVRRMNQAKAMGFSINLVYVRVSLHTALARNAKRERNVPESIIREKALNIATSFELTAPHADAIEVIENE